METILQGFKEFCNEGYHAGYFLGRADRSNGNPSRLDLQDCGKWSWHFYHGYVRGFKGMPKGILKVLPD